MNCDNLLRLLDEMPLPRWTPAQLADARQHCQTCDNCRIQMQQQQALFVAFEQMTLPERAQKDALQLTPMRRQNRWSYSLTRIASATAVLFLCVGSIYQLLTDGGLSLYLYADGSRLESLINLGYHASALPVALTLVGLVYALTHGTAGNSR